jgi:GNAT superfamily N-acetyltransferase
VSSKRLCELKRFSTAPSARGKGLGRMLLQAIAEKGRGLGHDEMRLDTSADLIAAIRVHEHVGFERYARDGEEEHPVTIYYRLDFKEMPK